MSFTTQNLTLHNGTAIPLFGLDTITLNESTAAAAVSNALNDGIRHIATSAEYSIESAIGEALQKSGVSRAELFLTDEIRGLRNTDALIRSAQASMRRLRTDYIDLLLLAWNGGGKEDDPANRDVYRSWKGLEALYKNGQAHAIGIVDFYPWQVEYLLQDVEIAPMVCYVGLYPGHPDIERLAAYAEHRITTMAYLPSGISKVMDSRELHILSEKHACTTREILVQYLKQKNCVITLSEPFLPSAAVFLSEEEMIFLDVMHDYLA